MITGWRLAAPEFAQTAEQMMTGEGGRRYGGRWNSVGRAVVYLGDSLALAGMELLVHLRAESVLQTYRKVPVFIPEHLVMHVGEDQLPQEWAQPSLYPVTQEIGDGWIECAQSTVLQVPSAVVRGETNYLVNPDHPGFSAIRTGPISRFQYDPRLAR